MGLTPQTAPGWTKGRTSVAALVMCCPECGSLRVYYRGKSAPESALVFWECEDCKKRWKGSAKKIGRAVVVE